MASKEKKPGNCNYETPRGYCESKPIDGEDRCGVHAGASPVGNMKHGLYADRQNYYESLEPKAQAWIDAVVSSLLEDAPFDATNFAKFQKLRNIAIDMHKVRDANKYISEEGIKKEDTVGMTDDGDAIVKEVEHELNVAVDRLKKTNTRELKELGLLDDPESQKAESGKSIAKELSKLNEDDS